MLETIGDYAMVVFYVGAIVLVAIWLIIKFINVIKKKSNGEDVTQDLNEIATTISNVITNKLNKLCTKNNVSVDANVVSELITSQITSKAVQASERKNDENEKKIKGEN